MITENLGISQPYHPCYKHNSVEIEFVALAEVHPSWRLRAFRQTEGAQKVLHPVR